MTTHVELTEEERTEVLSFWRDFVLSGGESATPSAFMLDALNDETVRDTFLFWHIGGDPFSHPDSAWSDNPQVMEAMAVLGPVPTNYTNTVLAMTKATEEVNATWPGLESLDTATVLVVAHVMMGMLLKQWEQANKLLVDITRLNLQLGSKDPDHEFIHRGPVEAMAMALAIIRKDAARGETEQVDSMLKNVFAVKRLPTLVNREENKNESA
jgi:hypothetical protein